MIRSPYLLTPSPILYCLSLSQAHKATKVPVIIHNCYIFQSAVRHVFYISHKATYFIIGTLKVGNVVLKLNRTRFEILLLLVPYQHDQPQQSLNVALDVTLSRSLKVQINIPVESYQIQFYFRPTRGNIFPSSFYHAQMHRNDLDFLP